MHGYKAAGARRVYGKRRTMPVEEVGNAIGQDAASGSGGSVCRYIFGVAVGCRVVSPTCLLRS